MTQNNYFVDRFNLQANKHIDTRRMYEPYIIVLDVSWIDYECELNNWFFEKFPPRAIIECVSRIPTFEDYDPIFWEEVENRFDDHELEQIDLVCIETVVQSIIERFYLKIDELFPVSEHGYVFKEWIDLNTLVMCRSDKVNNYKNIHCGI